MAQTLCTFRRHKREEEVNHCDEPPLCRECWKSPPFWEEVYVALRASEKLVCGIMKSGGKENVAIRADGKKNCFEQQVQVISAMKKEQNHSHRMMTQGPQKHITVR